MVELNSKLTGVIPRQELCDEHGALRYKVGERIKAYVLAGKRGDVILSTSISQTAAKNNALEMAHEGKLPVRGRVRAVKKGGFEVSIMGRIAFCPISQIARAFVDKPGEYIGKELDFRITRLNSRDMVVSRLALLEEQGRETMEKLEAALASGRGISGQVAELRSFGAMIELGGVWGMLHISELGHGHPAHPSEVLSVGEEVTVRVKSLDTSYRPPRISLSIKELLPDPWETAAPELIPGNSYQGKVVRLTDFGAFVELRPGLDGLIHLTEMSWEKRINHPRELLQEGGLVSVRLLNCDLVKRRLSLSLKQAEEDPWEEAEKNFAPGSRHDGQDIDRRAFERYEKSRMGSSKIALTGQNQRPGSFGQILQQSLSRRK